VQRGISVAKFQVAKVQIFYEIEVEKTFLPCDRGLLLIIVLLF
jgi:hypothetical protein